jgi:hypothetical protein
MTKELPSIEALDAAAKAVHYDHWKEAAGALGLVHPARISIIAHARTLEQLWAADPSTKPVDEDLAIAREACAQRAEAGGNAFTAEKYRAGKYDGVLGIDIALRAVKLTREACNG